MISIGLAVVLLITASALSTGPAAAGTVDDEQRFLQLINQTRAGAGLPPLMANGELTAVARSWSSSMAANDRLAHTPNMTQGISADWVVLGENVGVHGVGDVDQLFQAFVASPSHYQNLVDPRFQYVGIGVVHTSAGKLWTTHRFMAVDAPPPATSPPTTASPSTASPTSSQPTAPPTAPPTTQPPTTRPPSTLEPVPTTTPSTTPPTTDRTTSQPATGPSTTAPSGPADPYDQITGPGADHDRPGEGVVVTPLGREDDVDPSELIQPDAATIEDVLIDLVAAGI